MQFKRKHLTKLKNDNLSLGRGEIRGCHSNTELALDIHIMALYEYQGYETGHGWTMKPGNLEGGFWGDH